VLHVVFAGYTIYWRNCSQWRQVVGAGFCVLNRELCQCIVFLVVVNLKSVLEEWNKSFIFHCRDYHNKWKFKNVENTARQYY